MAQRSEPTWAELLRDAGRRIHNMDRIDAKAGFSTPSEVEVTETLRVALTALQAAHTAKDWRLLGDAAIYISEAIELLNPMARGA